MAKLRVFVSSTYYDLRHIRSSMEGFIEGMGYEPVLFESGDIPFHHDITLADACYNEVNNSHMLILIVGGRYGSAAEERKKRAPETEIEKMYETYNSVTKNEYETAREKDIPVFIFVEKGVKAEYETFKSNRSNDTIKYAHVDSVNIFLLLDEILSQKRNNYVKEFDKYEDIVGWLKDQWAGIFADLLTKKKDSKILRDMSAQITELNQVSRSMKEYTESIMRKVKPDNFEEIINKQESKIRASKVKAFSQEPMISYILDENKKSIPPLTGYRLFRAFEKSKNLIDFLEKAALPKAFIDNEILEKHKEVAQKDYELLRATFLGEVSEDIDELAIEQLTD